MSSKFTELAIDCANPELVGRFWQKVLGYEVKHQDADSLYIEGEEGSGPGISFLQVPEPKVVKNRVHIDLRPVGRSRDEEVGRIIALGARRVSVGQGNDVSWVVLADPEGNEFCVLGKRMGP